MTAQDAVPPALQVSGLSKRYRDVVAVDDVDLTLHDGEILALVGPSGCGKSTLIRLITGLVTPDAGRVVLGGQEVGGPKVHLPPEKRRVGVVFQEHGLFPHLTVADNIAFGLTGRSAADRRTRIEEVLELVHLPDLDSRFPHELSGGQRQRVALARAMAPEPEVILLDEPFASLDPNLRQRIRTQTLAILHDAKASALFVTHDQIEALAMGDRVAVMAEGRLEQVGDPEAVYSLPVNRFVGTFLGEADFLPATRRDGLLHTEVATCPALGVQREAGDLMVRPHEVLITPDPDGPAVIVASEYRGAHVMYTLALESGRSLRSLLPHTAHHPVGTRVSVEFEYGHTPAVLEPEPDVV